MAAAPPAGSPGHPGKTLHEMRRSAGLTLDQLATLSGSDKGYISRVERGERTPSTYWLHHVSRVLADAVGAGATS